jgi:predicted amidophosphoribosyltransferase
MTMEAQRQLRAARRAHGLCPECGGKKRRANHYCDACGARRREQQQARQGWQPYRVGGPGTPPIYGEGA